MSRLPWNEVFDDLILGDVLFFYQNITNTRFKVVAKSSVIRTVNLLCLNTKKIYKDWSPISIADVSYILRVEKHNNLTEEDVL